MPVPASTAERLAGKLTLFSYRGLVKALAFNLASELSIALRVGGPSGDTNEEVRASDARIRGQIVDKVSEAFSRENLTRTIFAPEIDAERRREAFRRRHGDTEGPQQRNAADAFFRRLLGN